MYAPKLEKTKYHGAKFHTAEERALRRPANLTNTVGVSRVNVSEGRKSESLKAIELVHRVRKIPVYDICSARTH